MRTHASKAAREAAGLYLHYIVFRDSPDYPGRLVLKACNVGSVRNRVVAVADRLEDLHDFIPPGYANTGIPEGPMVEVWV